MIKSNNAIQDRFKDKCNGSKFVWLVISGALPIYIILLTISFTGIFINYTSANINSYRKIGHMSMYEWGRFIDLMNK